MGRSAVNARGSGYVRWWATAITIVATASLMVPLTPATAGDSQPQASVDTGTEREARPILRTLTIRSGEAWLVMRKSPRHLVIATAWYRSEGSCFVGTRKAPGRYEGTFTDLPGPADAHVRLRRTQLANGDTGLMIRTRFAQDSDYRDSDRQWLFRSKSDYLRVPWLAPPRTVLRTCLNSH